MAERLHTLVELKGDNPPKSSRGGLVEIDRCQTWERGQLRHDRRAKAGTLARDSIRCAGKKEPRGTNRGETCQGGGQKALK